MSMNDDKILELKKRIEKKKEDLGATQRFTPVTSCSLELDGVRYNLHAANRETLVLLACKIQALYTAANELELNDDLMLSGFHAHDWGQDIKARLAILDRKKTESDLAAMEAQLDKLLSVDKKTELELAAIEALLR